MRLFSALKLHLSSFWPSNSSPSHYYDSCSRSMLLLLCQWKDADLMEWQHVCELLSNACSKMGSKLVSLQEHTIENSPQQKEGLVDEWKMKFLVLEEKMASQEETKNAELSKLQSENLWLQNRLAEKLQQSRLQGDMIDQLKKDLINSVQKTEVSEGRRLCYEHKIKQLEKQLDSHSSSIKQSPSDMCSKAEYEAALESLQKEKKDSEKVLQKEILKLQAQLAICSHHNINKAQEGVSEGRCGEKLTQIQTDLSQKKKEVVLLQDVVEELYCQIRSLCKQLGTEVPLQTKLSHLKQLLGRDLECEGSCPVDCGEFFSERSL